MKDLKHFILVGPPASGKGTQGRFLADTFNLNSLSTGSLLRREVESCTELGRKALGYMDKAMLVPDEIVNDMVRGWLSEMDNDAWLLDGYPRTVAQAEALDHFLTQRGTSVDVVVWMDVARELIEQRIMHRRGMHPRAAMWCRRRKRNAPNAEAKWSPARMTTWRPSPAAGKTLKP